MFPLSDRTNIHQLGFQIFGPSPPQNGTTAQSTIYVTSDTVPAVAVWTNPDGGNFSSPANWQDSAIPGAISYAVFNLPNTYTVTLDQDFTNFQLVPQNGDVEIDLQGNTYTLTNHIRIGGPQAATLRLVNGQVSATYAIAASATGIAQLILDDATLTTSGTGLFDIGVAGGSGSVLVSGDSLLNTEFVRIGENAGSNGLLQIIGAQAHADVNGMQIGATGTGQLEVRQGASLHSTNFITLANFGSTAVGQILITDTGSTMIVDQGITIGDNGLGTLDITSGATLTAQSIDIGLQSTATGNVTVSGSNSVLNSASLVRVGVAGIGVLNVSNGGKLVAGNSVEISQLGKLGGNGTIDGDVVLLNGGRLSPGNSPGTLHIDGDLVQQSGSTIEIEVGGLMAGSEHDQVQVTGSAFLAGRLEVPIINGFVPSTDHNPIVLLEAASVNGQFSAINSPNLASVNPNVALKVNYGAQNVSLQFVAPSTEIQFAAETTTATWANA